jgi:hypothetical protein
MKSELLSVEDYVKSLPADRQEAVTKLRVICNKKLKGFNECMNYGMIGYVVSHKDYPAGYHCDPKQPLPFANIASQKNFIALYHMGMYADKTLLDWFVEEYPKHCKSKLDMGKSCIRFKKTEDIPYKLIEALMGKMNVKQWIGLYEGAFLKK